MYRIPVSNQNSGTVAERPAQPGLVGYLVQNSPDVRTALRSLVRFLYLHVQGAAVDLTLEDTWAVLSYGVYQPQVEASDQICDGAVAVMFNIMRILCGPDWRPAQVLLAHRKPEDARPYNRFFRAPPGSQQSGIR